MVDELVADLDLEVVRKELEKAGEALKARDRELLVVGEVHEDGLEAGLEEVLRKLALRNHDLLEALVARLDDLGRGRVEELEEDAERLEPRRRVARELELGARERGREELDAHDAQLGQRRGRLRRGRLGAHELRVLGVGDPERFLQQARELVVELDQRRLEADAVRHGVDVADLHGEPERAERLGEDGRHEPVADGHEQLRERRARHVAEDLERLLDGLAHARDLAAQLEQQEADDVVDLRLGVLRVLAHAGRRARLDDVQERVGDHIPVQRRLAGHVLEAKEEAADDVDPVVDRPADLEVDLAREDLEARRGARLACGERGPRSEDTDW
mgnify:CR=1 FL=1